MSLHLKSSYDGYGCCILEDDAKEVLGLVHALQSTYSTRVSGLLLKSIPYDLNWDSSYTCTFLFFGSLGEFPRIWWFQEKLAKPGIFRMSGVVMNECNWGKKDTLELVNKTHNLYVFGFLGRVCTFYISKLSSFQTLSSGIRIFRQSRSEINGTTLFCRQFVFWVIQLAVRLFADLLSSIHHVLLATSKDLYFRHL